MKNKVLSNFNKNLTIVISDRTVYLHIKCNDLCLITHNEPDVDLMTETCASVRKVHEKE
jgi:hypothetical protein